MWCKKFISNKALMIIERKNLIDVCWYQIILTERFFGTGSKLRNWIDKTSKQSGQIEPFHSFATKMKKERLDGFGFTLHSD